MLVPVNKRLLLTMLNCAFFRVNNFFFLKSRQSMAFEIEKDSLSQDFSFGDIDMFVAV